VSDTIILSLYCLEEIIYYLSSFSFDELDFFIQESQNVHPTLDTLLCVICTLLLLYYVSFVFSLSNAWSW